MNVRIDRKELLKMLDGARFLAGVSTNLTVTPAILMNAENGKLEVSATDLETYCQDFCPAEVTEQGRVVVPFKVLHDFVRKTETIEIRMVKEDDVLLKILSGTAVLRIACIDPDDFPTFPDFAETIVGTVKIADYDLKEMIDKTIFITGDVGETRPHIVGARLDVTKKGDRDFIRMTSTDGNVLSVVDRELDGVVTWGTALIPKTVLKKLNSILLRNAKKRNNEGFGFSQQSDVVSLKTNGGHLIAEFRNATASMWLLEPEFPDTEDMIEYDRRFPIIVDKGEFLKSLRQAMVMRDKNCNAMEVNIENDRFQMTFTNPDIGEVIETISVKYSGKAFKCAFDPSQFVDFLNVMDSDMIELNVSNNESPCVITGNQDEGFLGLIMPWRL